MKPEDFLSNYSEEVQTRAHMLRDLLYENLPNVQEEVDLPAKMIAFAYGRKYAELICMVIPSQKGLKLGFNRGIDFNDPAGLLEGIGKISRYVVIKSEEQIQSEELKALVVQAYDLYLKRMEIKSS